MQFRGCGSQGGFAQLQRARWGRFVQGEMPDKADWPSW